MSSKAIREYDGKRIVSTHLATLFEPNSNNTVSEIRWHAPRVAQIKINLHPIVSTTTMAILGPSTALTTSDDNLQKSMSGALLNDAEIQVQLVQALDQAERDHPWLRTERLVVKPDQLLKRRGKAGLLLLDKPWPEVKQWILEKAGSEIRIGEVVGPLKCFLVEPFIPHEADQEVYLCLQSKKEGDEIMFCEQGGIDVGDVDSKAKRLLIPTGDEPTLEQFSTLLTTAKLSQADQQMRPLIQFLKALFRLFINAHFTYLEINPLVVLKDGSIHLLDMAARLDQAAEFECSKKWWKMSGREDNSSIEFPAPFGRELTVEENYIASLDANTGASLKLTILNREGRVWTMVAGGGASVAYTDAIVSCGYVHELANYGEYSGAPSETQTYEYSKTILDLMTRGEAAGLTKSPKGKILFIGGGIANFTNVASTFKGIARAIEEYQHRLIAHRVSIFVRRGGPNYQEGLRRMRELGDSLSIPIYVFGPETHITAIVPMALEADKKGIPFSQAVEFYGEGKMQTNNNALLDQIFKPTAAGTRPLTPVSTTASISSVVNVNSGGGTEEIRPTGLVRTFSQENLALIEAIPDYQLFDRTTRAFVYGMQPKAVQGMLDYDYICQRPKPSVAAMIYPFGGDHVQKFYWGTKETLIPVYKDVLVAMERHPDVKVVVNFASHRSVLESCRELMMNSCDSNSDLGKPTTKIHTIAIIAEGVPERHAKVLNLLAREQSVTIIGPATVGGLRAGCFKIGNTGGMIDNIVSSKLYRSGSVAYVSKSGGMSNELNNIISRTTDGVLEGIAIGGDRYPGSTFIDHILRYEKDPACRMIVLLGEVGGTEEYRLIDAIKSGLIRKPIVGWCLGTCAGMFATEVQFGHAGALAGNESETALAKNAALKEVGVIVPETFEKMPDVIQSLYQRLVKEGKIIPTSEPEMPKIPIDYSWAQELGLIRKPAQFVSTICDDRGQELLYAGMPISSVFKENIGIGGVVSLLWFKRRLPEWACKFIEMVLMLTADHGPAVSGAHNTIVASRAGKDLVSCLASGLLTIGERFGGALDGAAEQFSSAHDQGLSPTDFVDSMRKQHKLILGIGHKIKSKTNPDLRVTIICDYARKHFPQTPLLDYAKAVEQVTTQKKENLILNVDGAIAVLFVDLLRHSGAFSREEADEYMRIGTLNGLFVLGRSIGFIGHYLDQKRLKQGLYRHPWDDISYLDPTQT